MINWFAAFLHQRQQRVKLKGTESQWQQINGGVPQGTLCGPQLFIHMVSDLHTDIPDVKFMDDTTLSELAPKKEGSQMQAAANQVEKWSEDNQLGINCTKTKDMLISFGTSPNISPLTINGSDIEQVQHSKLLGVIVQCDLKWDLHVNYMNSKASTRLHYLRCLKRAGLSPTELKQTYLALVRTVLEYACPVWATGLIKDNIRVLESLQIRACRIIYPKLSYEQACISLDLPILSDRRMDICKDFFIKMTYPGHRLHDLLPPARENRYGIRNFKPREPPKLTTERAKNSFVPYCLRHFQ